MNVNDFILKLPLSQRMLMGICLGFVFLIIITVAISSSQWHKDWTLIHPDATPPLALIQTSQTDELIAAIPEDHLFGKPLGQMPITNLQMTVTGIVKLSDSSGFASKATISIAGQPGKVYKVGDELPYGVKIHAISEDAVILANNGQFEKLPLPREKLIFKPRSFKEQV